MPSVNVRSADASAWTPLPPATPLVLQLGSAHVAEDGSPGGEKIELLPGADPGVVLLAEPGSRLRVNGHPLCGGLRVLQDRDELRVGPERCFYSATTAMAVEPYPGETASCPRCSGLLRQGTAAVRCRCGAWFHQSAESACFSYGATCPLCGGSTQLETEPWDPAEL
jgi:hypothetical protein